MAINSVSSYQNWYNNATYQTNALKERIGYDDSTSSTSSTSSSSTSSTSSSSSTNKTSSSYSSAAASANSFLLSYKDNLTALEAASKKLQVGAKDNVFSKYESAVAALNKADTEDARKAAQEKVDKAQEDIVSAISDFADKYNSTVSFLESNSSRSAGAKRQLESLQRSLSTNDAMKRALGVSIDTKGKLQVNEDELKKKLDNGYELVKDVMGGQYGIAQRTATKVTSILDSPIDTVIGKSTTTTASASSSSTNQSSSVGLDNSELGLDRSFFTSLAQFSKMGVYNMSNYYAVGMFVNTLV